MSPYGGTVIWTRLWLDNIPIGVEMDFLFAPRVGLCEEVTSRLCIDGLKKCRVIEVPTRHLKSNLMVRITSTLALIRLLSRGEYALVLPLLNDSNLLAFVALRIVRLFWRQKVKLVIRLAGYPLPARRVDSLRGQILCRLLRPVYHSASLVIAINREVKIQIQEMFGLPDERIIVSPISVPCSGDEVLTEREARPFRFTVLARLEPEKGVAHVIEAFNHLAEEGVDAELHIYGNGSSMGALKQQVIELGLELRAFFHGWAKNPMAVLTRSDCLVLASISEGTPRSILEAGCVGVPSIATNVGGVSEIITHGKSGWIFDYGDIEALSDLMRLAATMKVEYLTSLRREIKAKINDEFNLSAEIQRVGDALEKVM